MSWQKPQNEHRVFVDDLKQQNHAVYRLSQVLSLALRIEPLLLRNTRRRFIPTCSTELETELWFSTMMQTRSSKAAVMQGGIARALVNDLAEDEPRYRQAWRFVQEHIRHWSEGDRIEQDLRIAVRDGDRSVLEQGCRRILKTAFETQERDKHLQLARWIKGALPSLSQIDQEPVEELRWLYQYVAAVLGSPGRPRIAGDADQTLPGWLTEVLPQGQGQTVNLRLRPGVLECVKDKDAPHSHSVLIDLPLPTQVLLGFDGKKARCWEALWPGRVIRVPAGINSLTLRTLRGQQYKLSVKKSGDNLEPVAGHTELLFAYVPEDEKLSEQIAALLKRQGISVQRIEDSPSKVPLTSEGGVPLLRLWTRTAADYWQDNKRVLDSDQDASELAGMLLRTDLSVELPQGAGRAQVLDLAGWSGQADSPEVEKLLGDIKQWLGREGERPVPLPKESDEKPVRPGTERENKIQALLAEIKDPKTPPERRLAIGDKLDE